MLFGKKIKASLLNGVEKIERLFKNVKNRTNGKNLSQRIRYGFPKHKTKNQLLNVFVFDLETYNDQEFAEAYEAGLYDVNRLRDSWDRDLTPEEIQTEGKYVIVFNKTCGNPVLNMLKYISENYEGDEKT